MDVPKSRFVPDNARALQQLASACITDAAHGLPTGISDMVIIATLLLHVLRN